MNRQLVLVVEDDAAMAKVLNVALRANGYEVAEANTGSEALQKTEARTPDAMILDLGLPDMDGVDVATAVRATHELPIIVLSARSEEYQQIRALDAGANDYVTKPFREGELMARLRAALRRPVPLLERREMVVGSLRIDALERRVFLGAVEVELTRTQFKLLYVLARASGKVVTHQQLLREVWGPNQIEEMQYLRVYMRQLRAKLEEDPSDPKRILTALGIGYRLVSVG